MQIKQVVFNNKQISKKNVCAYARVSVNDDEMLHSLNNQIMFYKQEILSHPEWNFVGVFHDKPTTGTKEDRPEFLKMLDLCRQGKIDMIITKTISRFARNTITTLKYSRELKDLGVDIYFESERLHTISCEGELFLTLYAAMAQAESLSVSENCKWRIRRDFMEGIMTAFRILGYDFKDGNLTINKKEAETVKRIFNMYLSGKGLVAISNELNDEGVPTKLGGPFTPRAIHLILTNEKYAGDLLLQKWFVTDHLSKVKKKNKGELDSYYVKDNHDAIIERDVYERVQDEIVLRANKYECEHTTTIFPFRGVVKCGNCGATYRRKITHGGPVLICNTYNTRGKAACSSKQIPENTLLKVAAEVLNLDEFSKETFDAKVESITAFNGNRLVFNFKDGTKIETVWKDKSRAESWTPEMKQKAREKRYAASSNHQSD